jgi:hypothetical protein
VNSIARKPRGGEAPVAEGFVLILLLNEIGLLQLALGTFNGPDPDLRLLAKPHERPAGIYIWGLLAPGPLAAGVALFMQEMLTPRYAEVNFYSRPNTDVGRRFNETVGLTQGVQIGPIDPISGCSNANSRRRYTILMHPARARTKSESPLPAHLKT